MIMGDGAPRVGVKYFIPGLAESPATAMSQSYSYMLAVHARVICLRVLVPDLPVSLAA